MTTRVLLVCYYWPPSGGGGVMRWLRLTHALAEQDFEVTVVAPAEADYPLVDQALKERIHPRIQVLHRPILEPYALYRRFTGRPADVAMKPNQIRTTGPGRREKAARALRANLFVPDARVGWVAPLTAWLLRRWSHDPFDVVITTGPPHSLHLIGRALRAVKPIFWVADFRDPWTGIEYHDELGALPPARAAHRWLERDVLRHADQVVTVSPTWARELTEIGGRPVHSIPNGFDAAGTSPEHTRAIDDGVLLHMGLLGEDRAPPALFEAMDRAAGTCPNLRLKLVGSVAPEALERATAWGVRDRVTAEAPVPHRDALALMTSADVLLLSVAPGTDAAGRIPGKLFEYLGAGRPVLALCADDSDVAAILREVGGGLSAPPDRPATIAKQLVELLTVGRAVDEKALYAYSGEALAERYATLLRQG